VGKVGELGEQKQVRAAKAAGGFPSAAFILVVPCEGHGMKGLASDTRGTASYSAGDEARTGAFAARATR